MDKIRQLQAIRDLYSRGGNIIAHLKAGRASQQNTLEDILIAYDFQAGSYIKAVTEQEELFSGIFQAYADVVNPLGPVGSILEAGVGEATTLANLVAKLEPPVQYVAGLDVSWSRVKFGLAYYRHKTNKAAELIVADLFHIPYADNSFDVVYTSHSLEPNGGRETEALRELHRVANRWLVLFEPGYELADNPEAQARMRQHGYVTRLRAAADELGLNVIAHKRMPTSANPLNPTALLLIEKDREAPPATPGFQCPVTATALEAHADAYYSEAGLLAYPILKGVPCIMAQHAVVATHYLDAFQI